MTDIPRVEAQTHARNHVRKSAGRQASREGSMHTVKLAGRQAHTIAGREGGDKKEGKEASRQQAEVGSLLVCLLSYFIDCFLSC